MSRPDTRQRYWPPAQRPICWLTAFSWPFRACCSLLVIWPPFWLASEALIGADATILGMQIMRLGAGDLAFAALDMDAVILMGSGAH